MGWIIVVVLVYIPLMIGLHRLAVRYGRSNEAVGWLIVSLFVSPILMIVVVWCIGETEEKREERLVADELLKMRIRNEVNE